MKRIYARHGDLGLFKISEFPVGLKKKEDKIIAFGEISNHKHVLTPEDVKTQIDVYMDELGKKTYFEIQNGNGKLVHEEHKPLILKPGKYAIEIEEEYDYATETFRAVQD